MNESAPARPEHRGRRRILSDEWIPADDRGLRCPECGCRQWRTVATRPQEGWILRRKLCRNCGAALRTRERPEREN